MRRSRLICAALTLLLTLVVAHSGAGIVLGGPRHIVAGGGEQPSACTVNWLDAASYTKPACVNINKPDEDAVTNKYWVDLSGGAGSTCSQASPCDSFDDVLGKPGTAGGPAIIYVKGTGSMSWFNDTIHGSGDADCRTQACDNWILIRTWPAGSPGCATECTATLTGNSNMNSANVHHIMWDGGPDLKIRFQSDGAAGTYAQNINSDWHVVYRTQTFCTATTGVLGFQVGPTTVADHVYFINNEFHTCRLTNERHTWRNDRGSGHECAGRNEPARRHDAEHSGEALLSRHHVLQHDDRRRHVLAFDEPHTRGWRRVGAVADCVNDARDGCDHREHSRF
ncbi:MAG TPA: hypothetical protein VNI78_02255 [Vicinamibacterales bacterium]|nr:hypothetical protein [Vicinamibacterales bacterium]